MLVTDWNFRYETGLDKLDFAAGQVGLMQDELTALQPKLRVASSITEKLMVKIEQDTVIVEKKKEVKPNQTRSLELFHPVRSFFLDCRRRRGVGKRSCCRSTSYQRWLRVGFGRSHSGSGGGFGCTEYFDTAGYNFGEVHEESTVRRQTCHGSRTYQIGCLLVAPKHFRKKNLKLKLKLNLKRIEDNRSIL